MTEPDREEFDAILEQAIADLPQFARELLDEVPVMVEDEPNDDLRAEWEGPDFSGESDLCGLHSGIPLTEKSVADPGADHPLILIFRGPIRRLAGRSKRELRKQIRITLAHEMGHHFGFSEEDLAKRGLD